MKNINKFSLLILLVPAFCLGQKFEKFIAVDQLNKAKRIKYYIGEKIAVELKNKTTISGTIDKIRDSSFVIEKTDIPITEVSSVLITRSNFLTHGTMVLLAGGGAGFIIIDSFNNLINSDNPIIKKKVLLIGGGLIASALLFKLVLRKKYRIKGNRTLKIINTSPF